MSDSDLDTSSELELKFESDTEIALEDELATLSLKAYKTTSLDAIAAVQATLASRAADVTGLAAGACRLLLNAYTWNVADLSSAYLEDGDACARKITLRNVQDLAQNLALVKCGSGGMKGKGYKCPICLEMVKSTERASLGCHHAVCRQCFAIHIKTRAIEQRRVYSTSCPGSSECPLLISRETVVSLVPEQAAKFDEICARLWVDSGAQFRHCPMPGCDRITEKLTSEKVLEVECECGGSFCFECGLPCNHGAVPCGVASQWLALVDHEHRSTKWVLENTKACPQCKSKIERFDGCNHMACGNCHFEFCWMCSQSWLDHSGKSYYNCSKYVPNKTDTSTSKRQAERIQFYVLRYENHAALAAAVDDRATREAHALIAWTYVLLCTTVHSPNQVLLEELVGDLVKTIEETSQLVRQRAQALHKFVMDTRWVIDQRTVDKLS